ncbi:MAG: class I mannose-6-phosphate isomerase [Pseudobdellovibrionaceae bacterium]|nr:class I mannose-6-phosphate isomerase [Pseudobdellovibrionaceae bacterium]
MNLSQPMKLSPDLFTPLTRTPWAGRLIGGLYKKDILPASVHEPIGEAWEVSCDPDFPSQILGHDVSLLELIQQKPEAMLSPEYVHEHGATCEILIKLLNADDPLSVQVHPQDDDRYLKPEECGKPESWLVLHAEPGAGLYLGFSKPVPTQELARMLEKDEDLRPFLQFVPVKPGDYFEIQPGVPHAIGPGLVLLEPQRIVFGKSGKTYRFWDWGRRYDEHGRVDAAKGKPRPLHVTEALRIIRPAEQVGENFVSTLRRQVTLEKPLDGLSCSIYPANDYYQVIRLDMQAGVSFLLEIERGFGTLVSLTGRFICQGLQGQPQRFVGGEPGFIPHQALPMIMRAEDDSSCVLVIPRGADFRVKPLQ